MNTNFIHTFLIVVDTGSIKKAAQRLHYAQSTVSEQIRQLEADLPYPLFSRASNRIKLTAFGHDFIPYAREMDTLAEKINTFGESREMMQGELNICVYQSLLYSAIPRVLPTFKKEFPGVFLNITTDTGEDHISNLKKNKYDFLYVTDDLYDDPMINCAYIRSEPLAFVSNSDHPLANRKITLEEVLEYPQMRMESSGSCYRKLQGLIGSYGLTADFSVAIDSMHGIIRALTTYDGIAFLPLFSVGDYINTGRLSVLDVDIPPQFYYAQILSKNDTWLPPYATAFIDILREKIPERR